MAAGKPPPPHGTHAAVARHRRAKEPACEPCRAWWRDYMAERRATTHRRRWLRRTRAEALARLAATHPAEFARILAQLRRPHRATPSPHRV